MAQSIVKQTIDPLVYLPGDETSYHLHVWLCTCIICLPRHQQMVDCTWRGLLHWPSNLFLLAFLFHIHVKKYLPKKIILG